MKTRILFLLFSIFFALTIGLEAQNFWTQTSGWGASSLTHMVLKGDSLLAASNNLLKYSVDNGVTWTTMKDFGTALASRIFVTSDKDIIVGRPGFDNNCFQILRHDQTTVWETAQGEDITELITSFAQTTNGHLFAGVGPGSVIQTPGVYVSTNNGTNWTKTAKTYGRILCLLADGNTIYAGSESGKIIKSTSPYTNWTEVQDFTKPVYVIYKQGSDFYANGGQQLYKSTGSDNNYSQLNNFPVDTLYSMAYVTGSPDNFLYAGTYGHGIFRSSNGGTDWDSLGGLTLPKRAFAIVQLGDTLFAGMEDGAYKSNYVASYNPTVNAPTNLLAVSDSLEIRLNWTDSQSGITYSIYRKESLTGSYPVTPYKSGLTTNNYTDTISGSKATITFYYAVKAVHNVTGRKSANSNDDDGKSTWEPPVPPDEPQNLVATGGNNVVNLQWDAVTGDNMRYHVYRSTQSNNYGAALAQNLTATNYEDSQVSNGTRYYYVVRSDTSGNISTKPSNEVNVVPVKPNPDAPKNLLATPIDPDIVLTWTKSDSSDVTKYYIYRSESQGTDYVKTDSVNAPTTSSTFTLPEREKTYYFIVKSWDGVHESQESNEQNVILQTLAITLEVSPQSKYTVDRFDKITYKFQAYDQVHRKTQVNINVSNGLDGSVTPLSSDANGFRLWEFSVPGSQAFDNYSMTFTASKAGYQDSVVNRNVEVKSIPRASTSYSYVRHDSLDAANPVYWTFELVDHNETWFGGGPDLIINQGKDVIVNSFLKFTGNMIIDTIIGKVTTDDGKWSVRSPDGAAEDYVFFDGSQHTEFDFKTNYTATFTYAGGVTGTPSKLFGVVLNPLEMEFMGGAVSSGIKVNGFFTLNGVMAGCGDDPTKEIPFQGFTFDVDGINTVGAVLPSLSPDPIACFSNLTLTYQSSTDRLDLYGDFAISWLTLKGTASVQNGVIDLIDVFTALGAPADVGTTGMTMLGVKGSATGIQQSPMEMSLTGTLVSSTPDLFEIDFDGNVDFPQKFDFISNEVRIIQETTFGNWQIVGPMTGNFNITSDLEMSGDFKAGAIDNNNYIVDGSGTMKYSWNPDEKLRGAVEGVVTLQDFPNYFPFDLIEMFWEGGIPIVLNNSQIFVQDRKMKGNLHFGGTIGTLNFTLDLTKNYGDDGFLEIGTGAINVNGMIRKTWDKKDQVQAYDPHKLEGQSLPIMVMKKDGTQAISTNDTLNMSGGMDKVFIRIMSNTQVPGSYLVDPSGTKHEDDDIKDSTHIVYKSTQTKGKGYWVLKGDFEKGEWIAGTNEKETKTGDFRDVFATFNTRDMQLVVNKNQNDVTATWNKTAVPDEPYVEFYLALDSNDLTGMYIGSVNENVGEFDFTMSDTLPECIYYIFALRYENEVIDRFYSGELLINNKGNLLSPSILSSVYFAGTKKLTVNWQDLNTGTNIKGYLIRLTYADGSQEIVARPYKDTNNIEIDIDIDLVTNPTVKVEIAAYTEEGWQSCWSTIQDIVLDVEDYPLAGFSSDDDMVSVFPNPVGSTTNIRFRVQSNSNIKVGLYDLLGNKIKELTDKFYGNGIYDIELKTEGINSGTYYIKYQSDVITTTKLLVINK